MTSRREHGLIVGKARVTRLMDELHIRGMHRGTTTFTTKPDKTNPRAPDLVKRHFTATRPNLLWVSDFRYVSTWSGFVYVAFIIDVYSQMIIGWRASTSMTTKFVIDTLQQAVCSRQTILTVKAG